MSEIHHAFRRVPGRRHFIGGSESRVILGSDEAALLQRKSVNLEQIPVDFTHSLHA